MGGFGILDLGGWGFLFFKVSFACYVYFSTSKTTLIYYYISLYYIIFYYIIFYMGEMFWGDSKRDCCCCCCFFWGAFILNDSPFITDGLFACLCLMCRMQGGNEVQVGCD